MRKAVSYKHSKQREALFNLLSSTNTHPTAAWLYDQLRKDFPHLSQGTVYRNLKMLLCRPMNTVIKKLRRLAVIVLIHIALIFLDFALSASVLNMIEFYSKLSMRKAFALDKLL